MNILSKFLNAGKTASAPSAPTPSMAPHLGGQRTTHFEKDASPTAGLGSLAQIEARQREENLLRAIDAVAKPEPVTTYELDADSSVEKQALEIVARRGKKTTVRAFRHTGNGTIVWGGKNVTLSIPEGPIGEITASFILRACAAVEQKIDEGLDTEKLVAIYGEFLAQHTYMSQNGHTYENYERICLVDDELGRKADHNFRAFRQDRTKLHHHVAALIRIAHSKVDEINKRMTPHVRQIGLNAKAALEASIILLLENEIEAAESWGVAFAPSIQLNTLHAALQLVKRDMKDLDRHHSGAGSFVGIVKTLIDQKGKPDVSPR